MIAAHCGEPELVPAKMKNAPGIPAHSLQLGQHAVEDVGVPGDVRHAAEGAVVGEGLVGRPQVRRVLKPPPVAPRSAIVPESFHTVSDW